MQRKRRHRLLTADPSVGSAGDCLSIPVCLGQAVQAALVLLFCLLPFCVHSSIITNDNTTLVNFGTSYDTYPYHYYADYVSSWVTLGHPQFTNHWISASRSGGSLEDANDDRLERMGLPVWAGGRRAIGLIMADDNGGYTSNQVVTNLENTLLSPTNFFNGFAYTNEGGWCSTQSITWVGIGAIPHDSPDGDSGEVDRNDAVTNLFGSQGRPFVDMWNPLWMGGWSNDNNGAQLLGFYAGGHPYAAGSLAMGITIAQKLADVDTNVSLATLDFGTGSVVSTNHCVISDIHISGSTMTFTRHDDRLPMAWDVPDGTITNDCRNAFIAMPQLSNAFWFTIAITNLPAGDYNVSIDGNQLATLSSSALAAGWNMFTDWSSNSPYWKQRVAVLALVRLKDGADPVTLLDHSAGDVGPDGLDLVNYASNSRERWDNEGLRGDALVASLSLITSNLNVIDGKMHDLAQPTNHVFTISPAGQTITFPSPGDLVYGADPLVLTATASSGLPVSYSITSGPGSILNNILTITGPGSIVIDASQPGDSNWPPAPDVIQTITIAPKTLAVDVTVSDKVYDGTMAANIADLSIRGIVGTDEVAVAGGSATFSDKTAAVGKTVTVTGLSLTGTDAVKYTLDPNSETSTASITPATLTVAGVIAADKVYDGTATAVVDASAAVLSGTISGDEVTLTGTATGTFRSVNAGMGQTVTISGLSLDGADAGNYLLNPPTAAASIMPASVGAAVVSSASPALPGSNITFTVSLSALPPGGGIPTGNVIFKDGTNILGAGLVDAGGAATLETSSLSHGNHSISAEYQGDGNFLSATNGIVELIDTPPVAGAMTLWRYPASGVKIQISSLLTNGFDPDGDTFSLLSISAASDAGGIITIQGGWLVYKPPAGFTNDDSFVEVVQDGFGLATTGRVSVLIISDSNSSQNIVPPGSGIGNNLASVQFFGIPQRIYTIQYTTNVADQDWQTLGTAKASGRGLIQFFDDPPPDSLPRTYRSIYP